MRAMSSLSIGYSLVTAPTSAVREMVRFHFTMSVVKLREALPTTWMVCSGTRASRKKKPRMAAEMMSPMPSTAAPADFMMFLVCQFDTA